ncbi:deoxyribodipyrimidine photo-lyase [Acinetobacter sp. KS-LM10]|uniref:deoxyribodipyrimidine photo-lyase n=1 Tax=Acinetobacter sp. KS-LM10 TaxID=3120518 RepID=UPI0030CFC9D5
MQLIWFRQDLRIHDHTALWHATQAGPCIALVILSPKQWQLHHDAAIKIDFYLRQLKQLQSDLNALNIPLIIHTLDLWKDIPTYIQDLCSKLKIVNVHSNIEVGVNELNRDVKVQNILEAQSTRFELYHDRTLFPVGSIRNKSDLPYQVFGAFKKNLYEKLSIALAPCYPAPSTQSEIKVKDLNSDLLDAEILPTIHDFYPDFIEREQLWPVGEDSAWNILDQFLDDHVRYYKTQRDFPDVNGTSQLSTYLNIGILSIRQCVQALFREHHGHFFIDHEGQQTWLDELIWREFYQHILFDFPRVSKHLPFKSNTQNIVWRNAPEDLQAWQQGQTGIPIVDAGIRQMLATGWMHNRVRMIVAMFLSKNLLIDWRKGEQWFMQHLIDGDLAANNGGWQWCASTGTDSVPYFRIFNPVSQSQKFDAEGDYIRRWVPELAHLDAKTIHDPYAKNSQMKLDYPRPIVDLKQSRVRAIEAFKSV